MPKDIDVSQILLEFIDPHKKDESFEDFFSKVNFLFKTLRELRDESKHLKSEFLLSPENKKYLIDVQKHSEESYEQIKHVFNTLYDLKYKKK